MSKIDNSVSHRLVVRFKNQSDMNYWKNFFKEHTKDEDVIHIETRTRVDMEQIDE